MFIRLFPRFFVIVCNTKHYDYTNIFQSTQKCCFKSIKGQKQSRCLSYYCGKKGSLFEGQVRSCLAGLTVPLIQYNKNQIIMPFKLRLIRDFQKCIKQSQQPQEQQDAPLSSFSANNHGKQKQSFGKKIRKKNYNIYQNMLIRYPIEQRHVANFFNIIGINQEAVRSNQCQESYFRTLFYLKTVKKIESRPNYLLLHLVDANISFPPIDYIIDRFNSFGDKRFNNLASLIQQVTFRVTGIVKISTESQRETGAEFLQRYTEGLGSRMFVCRFSNNKMLISKSLLDALEYDADEFVLQTLRFRTPIYEAASAQRYYDVIVKFLENMINLLDLVCDRISLETFLDSSVIRFRDYFYTKKNRKLQCKIKTGMPHPLVTIFELQEITSKSEQFQNNMFSTFHSSQEVKQTREAIRKREIESVRQLMHLPKNFHPQYQHQVASYCLRQDNQSTK